MRTLKKNQQVLYYANPIEMTEICDGEYRTGEYTVVYGEPVRAKMNISPEHGVFEMTQYGSQPKITRTLIPDRVDVSITAQTVFWIDIPPTENHNYVVESMPKSLNSLKITVKRVK